MTSISKFIFLFFLFFITLDAQADKLYFSYEDISSCVVEQSNLYGVPEKLIWKVMKVESNGITTAINRGGTSFMSLTQADAQSKLEYFVANDLSADVGLMQINIYHTRRDFNLSSKELNQLLDPCTNIAMGTFILAKRFALVGYNWGAIASYNIGVNGMLGRAGKKVQKLGKIYIQRVANVSGSPYSVRTPFIN